MEEAKRMAVDIVTWNSLPYLPNLFASLAGQSTIDATVMVVDNASNDGTISWLQDTQPAVTVLRNFRNQGFARGHNQGIAFALSRWPEAEWSNRYVVVTNPDLEFAPDCLERLLAAMDADPGLAACGPKLLRARAVDQEEGRIVTERTDVIDSTGLRISKSRRVVDRGSGERDAGQYDGLTDVFGLSGACVCIRASALAEAKLAGEFFDEDFFAYKEDADLAWRMRRLGMRARLVPEAVAWHVRGTPSTPSAGLFASWRNRGRRPARVNVLSTRNQIWMVWKNDEWLNLILHSPWIVPSEFVKTLGSLVSLSILRGNLTALAGIGKMIRKRRELGRRARVGGGAPSFASDRGGAMRKWFV